MTPMQKRRFLSAAFTLLLPGSLLLAQPPASMSSNYSLFSAHPGDGGGGRSSGATVTMDAVTGGAIAGGVSTLTSGTVQTKTGYTGQLYDPKTLAVSASPSASVNEGDAVQLSARATLDDGSLLDPRASDVNWVILNGPIIKIDASGLAVAGSVTANTTASVQSLFGGIDGMLVLTVANFPYASHPLTWDDPTPGGNGPYQVFFGTSPASLDLVEMSTVPHYNPGKLNMGTTYFWQVLDGFGTDITPGGPGPVSFTTSLFRPDMRIGLKANPATHRGNNVYNTVGAGQVVRLKLTGSRQGKLHFSVENDGDSSDGLRIRGTKANKKFKYIKYFRLTGGRANVTAAAVNFGYTNSDVDPAEVITYQVQAKANGKTRANRNLSISATSVSDARGIDVAKGKVNAVVPKKRRRR